MHLNLENRISGWSDRNQPIKRAAPHFSLLFKEKAQNSSFTYTRSHGDSWVTMNPTFGLNASQTGSEPQTCFECIFDTFTGALLCGKCPHIILMVISYKRSSAKQTQILHI